MKKFKNFFQIRSVLFLTILAVVFYSGLYNAAAAENSKKEAANAALNIELKVAYVKNHTNPAVLDLKTGAETIFPEKFNEIKALSLNSKKDKLIIAGKLKNENGVYIADVNSKKITPLFEKKDIYFNSPSFSPDGKFAAYTACKKESPFAPSDVIIYDIEKKSEKNVTSQKPGAEKAIYYNYPKFSADQKSVLCSAANIPDLETPRYDSIFLVKLNLSGPVPVETLAGGATNYDENGEGKGFKASVPSVLDDGRIGFLKIVGVDCVLAALNPAKNGEITDLAAGIENLAMPSFSKDGKYAAFEIFNEDEKNPASSINLIEFSTKSVRKIAENGYKPAF